MIYVTGDKHGDFSRVIDFTKRFNTTTDDVMIVLGDAGINFHHNWKDVVLKKKLSEANITLLCIHGNHEMRPQTLPGYQLRKFMGGDVYVEDQWPNIKFARDGEIYNLNGHPHMAIGGAYSVDKQYRLMRGWGWWEDEQPSEDTKLYVEQILAKNNVYGILSHTCPQKYIPHETFLPGIDQSSVDTSTEKWLDGIEKSTSYNKWYCGHYHIEKAIDKMRFMYNDIIMIND